MNVGKKSADECWTFSLIAVEFNQFVVLLSFRKKSVREFLYKENPNNNNVVFSYPLYHHRDFFQKPWLGTRVFGRRPNP